MAAGGDSPHEERMCSRIGTDEANGAVLNSLQNVIQTYFSGRKVTVKEIMKSTVFHCISH